MDRMLPPVTARDSKIATIKVLLQLKDAGGSLFCNNSLSVDGVVVMVAFRSV